MLEKAREPVREAMKNICDCFTGADGGFSYVKLACLIEHLDIKAEMGDAASKEIINTVLRFNQLIKIASE